METTDFFGNCRKIGELGQLNIMRIIEQIGVESPPL
jgi:hypothetical protein